ncbi:hypothetical protein UFOVP787_182 [uncultured Caudovirales phage]|uniref:Uncharacterized protein n=1 Tax=uncultured Caudovirales phage TaxID=2100421 RepID=A0A6J5NVW5_9CAUD|nr:hypothetical protein UFOVP787_182 [uncultured Caudovirales phage]
MKLFWKVKKIDTPKDQKIEKIKKILFPPLDLHEQFQEDGTKIKFHIDYSVDSNLDAVLIDLQEGNNDAVVQKTISSVITRLNEVRRILEAYAELDKDAQYIIVDDGEKIKDIDIAED